MDCEIGKGCAKDPKPIEGGNDNGGLSGCGIQCTEDDIANASLEERMAWFSWLREDMNTRYGNNLGGWFLNVSTVVAGFIATGQNSNSWVMNVDASILASIAQGYSAYIENPSNPSTGLTNGGKEWFTFFQNFNNKASSSDLINQWGIAERAGTKDGTDQFGKAPFYGWLNPASDDWYFEGVGGAYRYFQSTICGSSDCTNTFFDPRITDAQVFGSFGSQYQFSPVWRALAPIYFSDYILGQ